MPRPRRHYALVPGSYLLDRRLIPSAMVAPAMSIEWAPLPDPEPSPGPDPGTNAPVAQPPLPPSGPIGPGTC
jgi:hypothetical protein